MYRLRKGHNLLQIIGRQRPQHVHSSPRQQCGIHFERRVFSGGPYEREQPAFHVRQEGILLAFVEAVYLVNKHQGAHRHQTGQRGLRLLDRLADVFDPTQHRADGDELRVKRSCHQASKGGFAYTWRPPQQTAVWLPRLERQSQRHARPQQVLLTNDIGQRFRAQALGQGRVGG
jgi:hypothetical protein